MRHAASEAWVLVRILVRFVAVGVLCWVMVRVVSHGCWWNLLLIPLVPIALFQLVISSGMLWLWANELWHPADGHS